MKSLLVVLSVALTCWGCAPTRPRTDPPLDEKSGQLPLDFLRREGNPIAWIFHAKIDEVSQAVCVSLGNGQYGGLGLAPTSPTAHGEYFGLGFGGRNPPCQCFYRLGKDGSKEWLPHSADFGIRLVPHGETTSVSVESRPPFRDGAALCCCAAPVMVLSCGRYSLFGPDLPSTTVEEYEILQRIGQVLKEPDMPPIRRLQIEVKE